MYVEAVVIILTLLIIILTFYYYYNLTPSHQDPHFSTCEDKCDPYVCQDYKWQMKAYKKCIRCQNDGYCSVPGNRPGVYHCKPCSQKKFNISCEKQYGCKNQSGRRYAPLNPKKTGCQPCWKN